MLPFRDIVWQAAMQAAMADGPRCLLLLLVSQIKSAISISTECAVPFSSRCGSTTGSAKKTLLVYGVTEK